LLLLQSLAFVTEWGHRVQANPRSPRAVFLHTLTPPCARHLIEAAFVVATRYLRLVVVWRPSAATVRSRRNVEGTFKIVDASLSRRKPWTSRYSTKSVSTTEAGRIWLTRLRPDVRCQRPVQRRVRERTPFSRGSGSRLQASIALSSQERR